MAPPPAPPPLLPDPDRVVRLSYFDTLTDTRPKVRDVRVDALIASLSRHDERREKDGPLFSPAIYKAKASRGNAQVVGLDLAVFEYDGEAPDWERLAPYGYVVYSTFNHEVVDADHPRGGPRVRLVLFLTRRVLARDWSDTWDRIHLHLTPGCDPACRDLARMQYLPACPPAGHRAAEPEVRHHPGGFLDPEQLPPLPPPEPRPVRPVAPRPPGAPRRPGDDFAQRGDYGAYLEKAGWTFLWERGGVAYWKRPGKPQGISATFNHNGSGNLHVFTSNAPPFQAHAWYSPLAIVAELEHGGDLKKAARALAQAGYGDPLPEPEVPPEGKDGGLEAFAEADVARPAPGAPPRRSGAGAAGPAGATGPPDDGAPPPGSGDAPAARGSRAASREPPADELDPWGDPVPLEADVGAAALPAWPADVLPAPLQAYVEAVARSFQVAPDLVAVSLLGVLAIAAQRKVQVEPQPDWVEQLALWACPIGESGSRRSAVLARVAAPLQRFETERRAREQEAADASESRLRLAKGDLQQAERDKARAAEALAKVQGKPSVPQAEREAAQKALDGQQRRVTERLADVRAAEAALVKPPRLLIEDATVEAAATVLAEQGERIGIVSAEGDFFENLGGRFGKQVPVSFWAKCYTGDRHVVDRRGGGGPDGTRPRTEVLERPCLSMVLSPQPVVLGELRDRRTLLLKKGIMARFLYAVPPSRVGYRELHPEALRGDVEQPWHAVVGGLLALDYAPGVSAVTGRGGPPRGQELPHRLHFTETAGAALDAFRADVERRLRPGGDLAGLGEWAHKYVGHVVRVATLLHLAQLALLARQSREEGQEAAVPTPLTPVTADAVAQAVALAPYLAAHARAALGLFADAAKTQGAAVIKTWLEARPRREFSQRDAHQACRRHFDGPDEVAEALDILEAYGYVQDVPGPLPRAAARWGRPKRRRLLTNPLWLPDPPDSPPPDAAAAAPAPPTEYAKGTFEYALSTGQNGSSPSGSGTFEDAEYGEYDPHGEVPPAGPAAGEPAPAMGADIPPNGDGSAPPLTHRAHRTQNPAYQEGIAPPAGVLKTYSKVPERTQKSDGVAPDAPQGDEDGPFGARAPHDPARLAFGAAQRHGFPSLRLRSGRTFGPGEGAWWRDVGRAEGARDSDALYRVVRHFDLGDEDGPALAGGADREESDR